ncbi:hypothetical protein [Neorhodopirellula lusitana]|uniref:hypothetical protein n=1 Tax=Neorhodopirellula lusitana TaxID=445327 RepID=UPI00384B1D97
MNTLLTQRLRLLRPVRIPDHLKCALRLLAGIRGDNHAMHRSGGVRCSTILARFSATAR